MLAQLHAMRFTGNDMRPRVVPDDLAPCSESREVVQPGTSLATSRTITRSEWFPTPGRYTLHVGWKEPGKDACQPESITIEVR